MSNRSPTVGRGIRARDLACVRGGHRVFAGIDFTVAPGGALLLRGPNGSGKTSLLRIIAGLLAPAEGRLTWNDRPLTDASDKIAYVGHLNAVKRALSVAENSAFWAAFHGSDGGDRRVTTALDRLGIGHLAPLPARLLSAGQRRRLGLARLLAAPASLWLLDEPMITLDADSIAAVESLIAAQRAGGGIVIVSDHGDRVLPGAAVLTLGATA